MPTKNHKKKHPKMDKYYVSGNQKWELSYVAKKFSVPVEVVRQAIKDLGKGRRRLYNYLRQLPMGK